MGPKEEREFFDEVQIAVRSYTYRLRMALALMTEHNTRLGVSRETLYVTTLINDLLEAAEDAQKAIWQANGSSSETGLGQDQF